MSFTKIYFCSKLLNLNNSRIERELVQSIEDDAYAFLTALGAPPPRRIHLNSLQNIIAQLNHMKMDIERALEPRLDFYIEVNLNFIFPLFSTLFLPSNFQANNKISFSESSKKFRRKRNRGQKRSSRVDRRPKCTRKCRIPSRSQYSSLLWSSKPPLFSSHSKLLFRTTNLLSSSSSLRLFLS